MEANIKADVEETDDFELETIDNFDPVAWNEFIASDWPFDKSGETAEAETDSESKADAPTMPPVEESNLKASGDCPGSEKEQLVPSTSSKVAPEVFKIPKTVNMFRIFAIGRVKKFLLGPPSLHSCTLIVSDPLKSELQIS